MKNVQVRTITFSQLGYSKITYKFIGNLEGCSALELKNGIDNWFSAKASECVVDLSELNGFDIVGLNLLVRMKMLSNDMRTLFSVKTPYKKEIVDVFEVTKMSQALNVEYDIRNTMRLAS